jgi:hypothetical protein
MDLKNSGLIKLKGALFLLVAAAASALLILRTPELVSVLLLAIALWSACRFYYFAFYVLHHYVDPSFRYSGLWSLLRHLVRAKAAQRPGERMISPTSSDSPK